MFVNVNPQSTLLLGQARGAAICGLVASGVPVAEYTALQLKQAVVGYGRATKEQMQQMVVRLLNLSGVPGTDAADALGMAICHAHGGDAEHARRIASLRRRAAVRRGRLAKKACAFAGAPRRCLVALHSHLTLKANPP